MKMICPYCGREIIQNVDAKCKEVLDYLNKKTGKKYKNDIYIKARLKESGITIEDCKRVIDVKLKNDFFVKKGFINPITLFRPLHFDNYLNEALGEKKSFDEVMMEKYEKRRKIK